MTKNEYRDAQLLEQRHALLDPPEPPHAFRDEDETETEWLVQVQFSGVRGGWTTASTYTARDAAHKARSDARVIYRNRATRVVRREIRTHVETA